LPPEGGEWTADQYTFRLIRDGDITEVPPEGSGDPQRAAASPPSHEAASEKDDADAPKRKPR
jgi:hypothetical protein